MKYFAFLCLCLFAAISFVSCKEQKQDNVLKVAATAVPHAEILEQIKPELANKGIQLEIIIVDDYQIPNRALADGEVDANFFQHEPFLESQKSQFGYSLTSYAGVHLEPMALYSKKISKPADLSKKSIVAIPSDPANQARALLLLEANGLITLSRHDVEANLLSITSNPLELHFLEIDAPLLPRALSDVDLAAINTNFALQGGLNPHKDALAIESADSLFVNILVIRQGEENNPALMELKKQLKSEKVGNFIEKQYKGAILHVK